MESVSISTFKATCLALIKKVKQTGDPLIITLRGEPIAQVVPPPKKETKHTWIGSAKGTGSITGDIVSPTGVTWEVTKDQG